MHCFRFLPHSLSLSLCSWCWRRRVCAFSLSHLLNHPPHPLSLSLFPTLASRHCLLFLFVVEGANVAVRPSTLLQPLLFCFRLLPFSVSSLSLLPSSSFSLTPPFCFWLLLFFFCVNMSCSFGSFWKLRFLFVSVWLWWWCEACVDLFKRREGQCAVFVSTRRPYCYQTTR